MWVAGGLGTHALVTHGLGAGEEIDLGTHWESPATFHQRTGTRDEYAIMRSLNPRRQRIRRSRRRLGG